MPLPLSIKKTHHFVSSFLLKALPAAVQYGFPGKELKVYGITGTDGKTTSSTLLYHTLKTAGYKVALISTVAAFIGDEEIDTGFHTTSPEPWQIHELLRKCVDAGIEHVVLEVTSHGIFQYRIWGIPFVYAGVTNISNEHLDYFIDWETLVAVKAQLLTSAQMAFVNEDDRSFPVLTSILEQQSVPFETYSQKMTTSAIDQAIKDRFPEQYNRWNAHLVLAMAQKIGVTDTDFIKAVKSFSGVKGRMENISNNKGFQVIVDFAHTPNALLQALTALRPQTKGQLIAVFGCAGLRDIKKRPAMAKISTEIADLAVFTAEDPRTEDINVIFRQMKEGVESKNLRKVVTIANRRDAIKFALEQAKKGDIVGIFGKGHELSMCYGTEETPWSDQKAVRELLGEMK